MFDVHSVASLRPNISLTIIGGAPGAGKSSLVRELVTQCNDRSVVAIVDHMPDDAGPTADRWIVAADDGADALADLAERDDPPDQVIVECGSSADLRRALGYGYMRGYRLDGTIVVTEPVGVQAAEDGVAGEWQLHKHATIADVVVLNKVDRVDERVAQNAQRIVERLAPAARILWTEHGRVSPPLLLGPSEPLDPLDGQVTIAPWSVEFAPAQTRRSGRGLGASRAAVNQSHRTWCLVADEPIEARTFRRWLQAVPRGILSGGGVVHLTDAMQHRHTFHFLGRRWRLDRDQPWGDETPSTRVWLVGAGDVA